MPGIHQPLVLVRLLVEDRQRLMLENVALRHQVAVRKRSVKRARIQDSDRMFWILMVRTLKEWRQAVLFVRPDTVVRWHRKGFRYCWKRKSRSQPGRPPIGMDVIHLIRRMSMENAGWGAPRIAAELALLGHQVADSTVAKYMVKVRKPDSSPRWGTFLRSHMDVTAACDFFVVPTATFKLLYVFVVLSHGRRAILHINVTHHPTAAWASRQILEAFPEELPRLLLHDRDSIYGWKFDRMVRALGIRQIRIAPRSPRQDPFVERVIGSIHRECTDHIIPFGRRHLLRVLREYVEYYNTVRPHQSLARNAPRPREVQAVGEVCAAPVLGGLHHRYYRAA